MRYCTMSFSQQSAIVSASLLSLFQGTLALQSFASRVTHCVNIPYLRHFDELRANAASVRFWSTPISPTYFILTRHPTQIVFTHTGH